MYVQVNMGQKSFEEQTAEVFQDLIPKLHLFQQLKYMEDQ